MPAPLTVVVPTLNAAGDLPATAAALVAGVTEGLIAEMIVTDGGSTDGTPAIAEDLGARLITGPAGRGGQIARGVAAARTDWVLILHADTRLSAGWVAASAAHIVDAPGRAGYFRLRFRADGVWPRIVADGANLRSRLADLPYGDQGLLLSRRLLDEVGGVPDLPLMEDVVLARRLRGRLTMLAAEAHTSAAAYEAQGWVRRPAANLLRLARFAAGADPERLAHGYRKP